MLLRWLLEKGSQGPVDLGFEPTGVETETQESVQKKMMYALHSPLKNLLQVLRTIIPVKLRNMTAMFEETSTSMCQIVITS